MIILNWNIRGMNAFRKRQILTDMIKDNKVDIVAIQETKKEDFKDRTLRSLSSHINTWTWLPSRGRSGGILFGCPSSKISIVEYHKHTFSITLILECKSSQMRWMYTIVYAPIDKQLKKLFWEEMTLSRTHSSYAWVISGDFNAVRYRYEKSGPAFDCRTSNAFNTFIQTHALLDMKLRDRKYTWSNGNRFALLDRTLVSHNWDDQFPSTSVSSLSSFGSDHCPILVKVGSQLDQPPIASKFDPAWLKEADFVELIHKWWINLPLSSSGDLAFLWKKKLKSLASKIKGWVKNHYGKKRKIKQNALQMLKHLESLKDIRCLTDRELEEWQLQKSILENIYLDEEIHWKNRSKQQWLDEGDKNTKFFHRVASHRHKKTRISRISNGHTDLTDVKDIQIHALSYYK